MEHRYNKDSMEFEEHLFDDIEPVFKEAKEDKDESKTESALDRMKRTPLDEVKSIIDAAKHGSTERLQEHRARQKLAQIINRGPRKVQDFLDRTKE